MADRDPHAGLLRDIREGSVAVVMKEVVALSPLVPADRTALPRRDTCKSCCRMSADRPDGNQRNPQRKDRPIHRRRSLRKKRPWPNRHRQQDRPFGHVGKCAVAVVTVEHHAAEASHLKVRPAIVVVVANRRAHGPARCSPTPAFSVTSVKVPS